MQKNAKIYYEKLKYDENTFYKHIYPKVEYLQNYLKNTNIENSYNFEAIKVNNFVINSIMYSCLFNKFKNIISENNEIFSEIKSALKYDKLSYFIYAETYEITRNMLFYIYNKTNKLNNIEVLNSMEVNYLVNYYKNKKLRKFDRYRFLFKYLSKNSINIKDFIINKELNSEFSIEDIETTINFLFFNSLYLFEKNNLIIDDQTKQKFYIELYKYTNNIIITSYEDALLYFIFEINMDPKYLNIKKKISKIKDFFITCYKGIEFLFFK